MTSQDTAFEPAHGKRRMVVVTDIPSPYRLHEFEALHAAMRERDIGLSVVYLATTEHRRHWTLDPATFGFPNVVASGWSPHVRGRPFYINPGVCWDVVRRPPTWLILGGAWFFPTIVGCELLGRLAARSWVLGWNESSGLDRHVLSHPWPMRFRRALLRRYHGWLVPGRRAADYVVSELVGRAVPLVHFANTVDERLFHDRVAHLRKDRAELRARHGVPEGQRVFLWPARLSPEKGILPFAEAIRSSGRRDYVILVAGEGPERGPIEAWLTRTGFPHLRLLGHRDPEQLLEFYALADALLLASLSEPFGFVAVEALWAGLPLLVSDRVGSVPEVLAEGENGWQFDPSKPGEARDAFLRLLDLTEDGLREASRRSVQRARERFASGPCASRFLDDLLQAFPPRA
jgi:glycosyltransferase involved in cell wall biosynthesis